MTEERKVLGVLKMERSKLIRTLSKFMGEELKQVTATLNMPNALKPGVGASRGEWAIKLFEWAESPTGCGIDKLTLEVEALMLDFLPKPQSSGTGGVNIGGNVSGTTSVTGSGNYIVTGTHQTEAKGQESMSSGQPSSMRRVVILTALRVEHSAVRAHLSNIKEDVHPHGTVYERGLFGEGSGVWEVLLAEIGAGNDGTAL